LFYTAAARRGLQDAAELSSPAIGCWLLLLLLLLLLLTHSTSRRLQMLIISGVWRRPGKYSRVPSVKVIQQ